MEKFDLKVEKNNIQLMHIFSENAGVSTKFILNEFSVKSTNVVAALTSIRGKVDLNTNCLQ